MYELWYTDEFKADARCLEPQAQARLKKVISKIMENPLRFKHLSGDDRFRVRFGVYRVLYRVAGNKVELVRIGKRDTVYD
jgi:mRNA-degrading endonuclease RelE of RelBE toxin-antitoxin system